MNPAPVKSVIHALSDAHQGIKQVLAGKPALTINTLNIITSCNDEFLKVLQLPKDTISGINLSDNPMNSRFLNALSKAQSEHIATFSGAIFLSAAVPHMVFECLLVASNMERNGNKTIDCIFTEFSLSEKKVESYLSDSGILSGLVDCTYAPVSVHGASGEALYVSPSVEKVLGYPVSYLLGKSPVDLVHPDDLPIIKDALNKLSNGYDILTTRYRMMHQSGTYILVECTSYLIVDAERNTRHIVNITRDVESQLFFERALERSEQKYYRLVMSLPTGISLLDISGNVLEMNDEMKKIMNIPEGNSFTGLNFFKVPAMQHSGIAVQLSNCIASRENISGDLVLPASMHSGEKKHLTYTFVPVLDPDESVVNVIAYVSDHTEKNKVESESREKVDFLNLVINAIKLPFFVKDENHKWVMLNDAAIEMMGHSREELIGKSDYDMYPKEQADVFWKYDELVLRNGSSVNEEQITWHDGSIHTVVTNKQLYVEKTSGKKFIVGTNHDITGYKKIEETLRASEQNYRELFDNASDFIITMDLDGNITNANRRLLTYMQTDLESMLRTNVFDYITEDGKAAAYAIRDNMFSGSIENSFEISATGLDGLEATYEVKASLIRSDDIPVGVQCVFSDVTERRDAHAKLEKYNRNLLELNKTKDKFFSIIAHDLRNPYSSMIGFSELLLEDLETLTQEEIRDYLKIIRNSAKNSLNLLENLLAWSRLETGRMPFDPSRVELTEVVNEVINVLFSLAYRKKIEINNMIDSDVVVYADKNMLNTILNNLVMNAIKFTPINGEITIFTGKNSIDAETEREFVKISVADTGIGMEPSVCEKLFSMNKHASSPGTEKEQGTGLGLILSREMVERHGGTITAESSPGNGSVFSFMVPLYKTE